MRQVFTPAYNSDLNISGKQNTLMSTILKATGNASVLSETSAVSGNRIISKITYLVFHRNRNVRQNNLINQGNKQEHSISGGLIPSDGTLNIKCTVSVPMLPPTPWGKGPGITCIHKHSDTNR